LNNKLYQVFHVNVFTKIMFKGNIATVIWFANGLRVCDMQQLAREFNTPETIFIFVEKVRFLLRFFTPTQEVNLCGHGTIAAAYVTAKVMGISEQYLTFFTKSGPLDVWLPIKETERIKIKMPIPKVFPVIGNTMELFGALISGDFSQFKRTCYTGYSKASLRLMVEVRDDHSLLKLSPDFDKLKHFLLLNDLTGVFAYSINSADCSLISGRMFAPVIGINEDPVNGNSSLMLSPVLLNKCLDEKQKSPSSFTVLQGRTLQREGEVFVDVKYSNNVISGVSLAGNAVGVYEFHMLINK
jgi:PhzF family phenazine biosynthesis protein